jgi:flagellar biosynthesis protein FlhB
VTTQPPTAAELARARREGRAPLSELAVLAATWLAVAAAVPSLAAALRASVREALAQVARADVDPWRAARAIAAPAVAPLGVALGAAVVAATAATLAQTRGARRAADPTKRTGEPGTWSTAAMTTAYGAALLLVGALGWRAGDLAWRLGAALAALAAVDVAWRARSWRRALRTTAEERRRERRDDEGDPAVKRERARRMR